MTCHHAHYNGYIGKMKEEVMRDCQKGKFTCLWWEQHLGETAWNLFKAINRIFL